MESRSDTTQPNEEPKRELTPEEGRRPTNDGGYRCDLCGAEMQEWHCRIICTACGYQRDCSDP